MALARPSAPARVPATGAPPANHFPPPFPPIDPEDHMTWARAIARGVRADYHFGENTQEEADLEAEAYLAVTNYAPRFDPFKAYRKSTEGAIARTCRRWRRGTVVETRLPATVTFGGVDQTDWVLAAARQVAFDRGLSRNRAARLALAALAIRVAIARAEAFDPVCAFRGWAAVEVRMRCKREAIRIRNGGMFMSSLDKELNRLKVGGLPTATGRSGDASGGQEKCEELLGHDCRRPELSEPPAEAAPPSPVCGDDAPPWVEALYVASRQQR